MMKTDEHAQQWFKKFSNIFRAAIRGYRKFLHFYWKPPNIVI